MKAPAVVPNAWTELRRHTPARIALGRSGVSQPTEPHLAFQLAHAQARDAVHRPFDSDSVAAALAENGFESLTARSAATDRAVYLQRPDLGRRLAAESAARLADLRDGDFDLAIVIADGLSALAVERHAVAFLSLLRSLLGEDPVAWRLAPVVVAHQARVALGDDVGAVLDAQMSLVLIGERPGLSSPDSMGLYLTWAPKPGRTDAERNCISNIRPEGLALPEAAARATWLMRAARARALTGVGLKDDSVVAPSVTTAGRPPFSLTNDPSKG
jgi:ethanolamine ammonia-lyase small subunit